jgi:hypothetical protein
MSTTLSTKSDLSTEVATLKKAVRQLLHLFDQKGEVEQSLTIPQFCRAENFSRAFFYELKKRGKAPRLMRHADGCVRISPQARKDWQREREGEANREHLEGHQSGGNPSTMRREDTTP